jgi:hypothetical protein
MSTIEHFVAKQPGQELKEYSQKYPGQLIVQTRTKSDLMITARAPGSKSATSVFIPKTLPTDVTRQSPCQTVLKSDDFLSLLSRGVLVLVVPDPKLNKFLKASDDRLRAILGKDKLELASLDELTKAKDEGEAPQVVVSAATVTTVDRLNRIYAGEDEYGTIESGEALLLEAQLSASDIDLAYIRANFKYPEALSAVWDAE